MKEFLILTPLTIPELMPPSPTTIRHLIESKQDHAFLDLLIADLPGSANTKINVLAGWRLYVNWVRFEGLSILNADSQQAEAYAEWLRESYQAPSTRNNRITQARKFYARLIETELISSNPFDDLHGELNPAHERRKSYSVEEIDRLLAHADAQAKLLILLGAHAGLTGGEVLELQYTSFHADYTVLELPDRTIQCSPELTAQLKVWITSQGDTPLYPLQLTGPVFPPMTVAQLRSIVFHLCLESNVTYKAWQALRNSAGIKMLNEKPERKDVMTELGLGHRMALRPMVKISGKGDGRKKK